MTDRLKGKGLIPPLRKRTRSGELYTRDAKIEAHLVELISLSRDELIARCALWRRDDPAYVPSECVLHFVRANRADNSDADFERLYKILVERILRSLPKSENADGKTASLTRSLIREKVFGRFVELLSGDRNVYSEKLDFFELRFDKALANLRRDAWEQVGRDDKRSTSLFDEETGELSAAVENAKGSFDPFGASESDAADYRSRLDAAIEGLPWEQSRIVEMIRQGIPIDSKEAEAITIAKTLGRSEKTIRTHRDKAYAAIRAALTQGDKL
jgi:hypothetical protein